MLCRWIVGAVVLPLLLLGAVGCGGDGGGEAPKVSGSGPKGKAVTPKLGNPGEKGSSLQAE